MIVGYVERTKQKLDKILGDNEKTNANDILEALECAYEAIRILETENNYNYESGRADGMERMAVILTGQVGKE